MSSPVSSPNPYQILDLDYAQLGFRCGLEVHHQILTERKLFCHCPAGRYSTKVDAEVLRHMRPTLSELGEYDPCALMEFKTKKEIIYLLNKESVCTYEMDDTPPFFIDERAVDIALEIAMLLGCQIVGEAHIARKQYLDGSIPTGFQRTTLVGVSGALPYKDRKIGIIQLGLEEDSCREVADVGHQIQFRTDRLGMPLIEVVTKSEMYHPYEVAEVGKLISQLLRATGKVRRGIGSVRQDVNVSINGSTRVEIKGVPRIPLFPRLVSVEAYRQMRLLELRDRLHQHGITENTLEYAVHELTPDQIHFRTPQLAAAQAARQRIVAVRVLGVAGLLPADVQPGRTFAHEISGRIRVIACIDTMPNMFHTDTDHDFSLFHEERTMVRAMTDAHPNDVVIVLYGPDEDVTTAVNETVARIREATQGVPSETRQWRKGGWTDFERLLAGPNRMYPDTDSPPTVIAPDRVAKIRAQLPETPWERKTRLVNAGLNGELAEALLRSPFYDLFWKVLGDGPIAAKRVARVFVQEVRAAQRKGLQPQKISNEAWRDLFDQLRQGKLHWEAVPYLIRHRSRRTGADWLAIAAKQQMLPVAEDEWQTMVDSLVHLTPRSSDPAARVRWLMGQLQRPAGRIPAAAAARSIIEKLASNGRSNGKVKPKKMAT